MTTHNQLMLLRPNFEHGIEQHPDLRVFIADDQGSEILRRWYSRKSFEKYDFGRTITKWCKLEPGFEIGFGGDADGALRFVDLAVAAGACLQSSDAKKLSFEVDHRLPEEYGAFAAEIRWVHCIFQMAWQRPQRGIVSAAKSMLLGPDGQSGFQSVLPINPFLASVILIDALSLPPDQARNKFIYERATQGVPWKQIQAEVNAQASTRRWGAFESERSVVAAARRFAENNQLPPVPERKKGRRPKPK